MNIRDTFLASFSTEPHIYKNALPEQLLGQIYPDTVFLNASMSILAGGTVEAFAPLSYDIKGFSSYLLLFTQSGSGTLTISNQIYTLSENTLLFLDCRKPYKLNISTTVWTFQVFYLTGLQLKLIINVFTKQANMFTMLTFIPAFMIILINFFRLFYLMICHVSLLLSNG